MKIEVKPDRSTDEGRKSASFLVRVWSEASGADDAAGAGGRGPLRIYVKDLHTGEESYLQDPAGLGDRMRRSLEEAARAE